MSLLLRSIEEIQKYLPASKDFEWDAIKPFVAPAQRAFMLPILGRTQHDALVQEYADQSLSEANTKLLPLVQAPLAYFTFRMFSNVGNVNISQAGFHMTVSEHSKQIFEWMFDDMNGAFEMIAMIGCDDLIEFLEENSTDYPLWAASEAAAYTKELFVNSAKEFNNIYHIAHSRSIYLSMRHIIKKVERNYILPALCTELHELLHTATILNEDYLALMEDIKQAVVYYTVFESGPEMLAKIDNYGYINKSTSDRQTLKVITKATDDNISSKIEQARKDGKTALDRITLRLTKNPELFPEYMASECYTPPAQYTPQNDPTKKTFRLL